MLEIFRFFLYTLINLFVSFLNIFVWRTKKIWLFGAWMGNTFSDNSRFLFQFVDANKKELNIKKVFWVTRNEDVFLEMKKMGYEVLMMHSLKSFYYHIRSGVHLICNNAYSAKYKHDIMTCLSIWATKIQLWHGVGIKACGRLTNKGKHTFKNWIFDNVLFPFFEPGVWGRAYMLVTSEENKRVAIEDIRIRKNRIILGTYPRFLRPTLLTSSENIVISRINFIKKKYNKKIILYLPTFRKNGSKYLEPSSIDGFTDFLRRNNILWIQKKHSADLIKSSEVIDDNVLTLEPNLDVNVVYDCIDLLITDYSSATTDAIFRDKMTLEYCPDYNDYSSFDRGFVNDFEKYHIGNFVINPTELFDKIMLCINKNAKDIDKHIRTKQFLLGTDDWDYYKLFNAIKKATNV